ncbi:phosphoribosyl transferase [Rhodobacterales bacterium 56_14_T64]|nr:phosphoribosyl transferase [Rhodobacterales bacterium 56_14_T64]
MFEDRETAGKELALKLSVLSLDDPVVLALPRGGVPVALPIARALRAPLDLILVRKIGMPGNPELAAGAVVEGAAPVFNAALLQSAGLGSDDFEDAAARKRIEIAERRKMYLGSRGAIDLTGRTVVVVDDGIATGATVRAALLGLQVRGPRRIVLAVPAAPPDVVDELSGLVDTVICLFSPQPFWSVGAHYRDFRQVADDAVAAMLAEADQADTTKDMKA